MADGGAVVREAGVARETHEDRGAGEARVCAVVVTFQRLELLQRLVAALLAQSVPPASVVVVDNGSGDGTAAWLAERGAADPRIVPLRLEVNAGPAGGFAAGFARALEDGFTHLWAMDDDVDVDPGCLEALLAARTGAEESLFPAVRDESGVPTRYPGWSAVLLPVPAVRRAGLPMADLFWWIEDTEYLQWRLPRQLGVRPRTVPAARVRHGAPRRGGEKPAWKYYYEVRNTAYYRLHVQTTSWRRRGYRLAAVLSRSLVRAATESQSRRKLGYVLLGAWHGLRGRLGRLVEPG